MIWGIAVHTSTLGLSTTLQQVARVSGYVRMEGFMAISGLLVGLVIDRYGTTHTIKRRLVALGVPLVTSLLLLNPITNTLAYSFHNEPITLAAYLAGGGDPKADGPMVWHLHLWFLFALIAYVLLSPLIGFALRHVLPLLQTRIETASHARRFFVLALLVPLGCLGTRVLFEILIEPFLAERLVFVVRSTLYYLPFFAVGFALYRCPPLLEAFARIHWPHILIAPLLVVAITLTFHDLPKLTAEALKVLAESYLSVVFAATLFALARRYFSRESRWISVLSDAAYSIYLLHFLVIYVVATALRPFTGDSGTLVLLVMLLTFALTLALHQFVIRRIPLLRFLFNGRRARPSAPVPSVSPEQASTTAPAASAPSALQISPP